MGIYSVTIATDDGEVGTVELRSDTSSPPTTVRCSAQNNFSVSGVLGVTGTSTVRSVLVYVVPPGHNVRLVTSGTATFTLANQTEETIG